MTRVRRMQKGRRPAAGGVLFEVIAVETGVDGRCENRGLTLGRAFLYHSELQGRSGTSEDSVDKSHILKSGTTDLLSLWALACKQWGT